MVKAAQVGVCQVVVGVVAEAEACGDNFEHPFCASAVSMLLLDSET